MQAGAFFQWANLNYTKIQACSIATEKTQTEAAKSHISKQTSSCHGLARYPSICTSVCLAITRIEI